LAVHSQHIALSEKLSIAISKELSTNIIPEIYPLNQLGNPQDQLNAVKLGTIEMVIVSAEELWNFPEFSIFSLPYLYKDYDELDEFMNNPEIEEIYEKVLKSENMMYLGWGYHSYRHIVEIANAIEDSTVGISKNNKYLDRFLRSEGFKVQEHETSGIERDYKNLPFHFIELSSFDIYYGNLTTYIEDIPYENYLLVPSIYIISSSFWEKISVKERQLLQNAIDQSILYEKQLMKDFEDDYRSTLTMQNRDGFFPAPETDELFQLWSEDNNYILRK